MESASPPFFVRNVFTTLANSQHVDKVSLRVQPSLFNNQLINEVFHFFLVSRSGVDEVDRELDNEDLSDNSDADTNPDRLDIHRGYNTPK
jgi:hypothetical protein